jgi:hypothetical protein
MTLRRFKREISYLLSGHPSDYSSLIGRSYTSVIETKGKSRLNPKENNSQIKPSEQTLRIKAVQSLYNENYVNAKPVF